MRTNRFTTWFLLGYLALLMNVGPSAHHAEFFGLHAHCISDSAPHSHCAWSGSGESGCCCHHNRDNTISPPVDSSESSEDAMVLCADASNKCSGCLFCDYFDHLHALVSSIDFGVEETPNDDALALTVEVILFRSVECSARGPPALLVG